MNGNLGVSRNIESTPSAHKQALFIESAQIFRVNSSRSQIADLQHPNLLCEFQNLLCFCLFLSHVYKYIQIIISVNIYTQSWISRTVRNQTSTTKSGLNSHVGA